MPLNHVSHLAIGWSSLNTWGYKGNSTPRYHCRNRGRLCHLINCFACINNIRKYCAAGEICFPKRHLASDQPLTWVSTRRDSARAFQSADFLTQRRGIPFVYVRSQSNIEPSPHNFQYRRLHTFSSKYLINRRNGALYSGIRHTAVACDTKLHTVAQRGGSCITASDRPVSRTTLFAMFSLTSASESAGQITVQLLRTRTRNSLLTMRPILRRIGFGTLCLFRHAIAIQLLKAIVCCAQNIHQGSHFLRNLLDKPARIYLLVSFRVAGSMLPPLSAVKNTIGRVRPFTINLNTETIGKYSASSMSSQ